ncbi:MAG: hypothetical protein RBS40_14545 [Rhodocyclaceae bacterium]|jgi:hypothetical protein|nr:hypothetical protein [Rhodocyclaceae bacterium]
MSLANLHSVSAALLLASTMIANAQTMAEDRKDHSRYFGIELTEGVSVAAESPVEDFILYRFEKQRKVLLTVYVGNTPERPISAVDATVFEAGGVRVVSKWDRKGKLLRRDWFVRLCQQGWPQYLHAFTGEDARAGDRLASSLKVKAPEKIGVRPQWHYLKRKSFAIKKIEMG